MYLSIQLSPQDENIFQATNFLLSGATASDLLVCAGCDYSPQWQALGLGCATAKRAKGLELSWQERGGHSCALIPASPFKIFARSTAASSLATVRLTFFPSLD